VLKITAAYFELIGTELYLNPTSDFSYQRILRYICYFPFWNLQGGITISALACAYLQADISDVKSREGQEEETLKSEEVKQLLTLIYIIRWSAEGRGKGTKIKVRIPKNIKCMRGIESFIYPPHYRWKREKRKKCFAASQKAKGE